jgi:hypothetical protein
MRATRVEIVSNTLRFGRYQNYHLVAEKSRRVEEGGIFIESLIFRPEQKPGPLAVAWQNSVMAVNCCGLRVSVACQGVHRRGETRG